MYICDVFIREIEICLTSLICSYLYIRSYVRKCIRISILYFIMILVAHSQQKNMFSKDGSCFLEGERVDNVFSTCQYIFLRTCMQIFPKVSQKAVFFVEIGFYFGKLDTAVDFTSNIVQLYRISTCLRTVYISRRNVEILQEICTVRTSNIFSQYSVQLRTYHHPLLSSNCFSTYV